MQSPAQQSSCVIARSEATRQSTLAANSGLLRLRLAMTPYLSN